MVADVVTADNDREVGFGLVVVGAGDRSWILAW